MCPAKINLLRADILETKADVGIFAIHRQKNMKTFALSRQLLKRCGQSVQDELYNKDKSKELILGQVEKTSAGQMNNFKNLMFICLLQYVDGNEKHFQQSFLECLELSAVFGYKSICVPALGTGGLNYPPEKVAISTINAVALHNLQFPHTPLETINVVLLDGDVKLIKVYLKICVLGRALLDETSSVSEPESAYLSSGACGGGEDLLKDSPSSYDDDNQVFLPSNHSYDGGSVGPSGDGTQSNGNSKKVPSSASAHGSKSATKSAQGQAKKKKSSAQSMCALLLQKLGTIALFSLGPLKFFVRPSFDPKSVGVSFDIRVDIGFLSSFIPPGLKDFFENLLQANA